MNKKYITLVQYLMYNLH